MLSIVVIVVKCIKISLTPVTLIMCIWMAPCCDCPPSFESSTLYCTGKGRVEMWYRVKSGRVRDCDCEWISRQKECDSKLLLISNFDYHRHNIVWVRVESIKMNAGYCVRCSRGIHKKSIHIIMHVLDFMFDINLWFSTIIRIKESFAAMMVAVTMVCLFGCVWSRSHF